MTYIKKAILYLHTLEARFLEYWISSAFKRSAWFQWNIDPKPSFYDHDADLYYGWKSSLNPMWLERGFFNLLVLKGGGVLEISCGDGFNTKYFYSHKSEYITAIDLCQEAINHASSKNYADNIKYIQADIRDGIISKNYKNIIWDFGFPFLEFFSYYELISIFENISESLESDGIFSGSTQPLNNQILKSFQGSLNSKAELSNFLLDKFKYVVVHETEYLSRHNLYFWASNSPLPLSGWG